MVPFREGQGQPQIQKAMSRDGGVLLVDKPEGPSSAQVVQMVKNVLRAKKVGHLGTLDPFASGLLLTYLSEYWFASQSELV